MATNPAKILVSQKLILPINLVSAQWPDPTFAIAITKQKYVHLQACCRGSCCGAGTFYCLMMTLGIATGFPCAFTWLPQLISRGEIRSMHGMQVQLLLCLSELVNAYMLLLHLHAGQRLSCNLSNPPYWSTTLHIEEGRC